MKQYDLSLGEAVELIMQRRGVSRRVAKRMLIKNLRKGELTVMAKKIDPDGRILDQKTVPAEFWQAPWTDNEGDGDE